MYNKLNQECLFVTPFDFSFSAYKKQYKKLGKQRFFKWYYIKV